MGDVVAFPTGRAGGHRVPERPDAEPADGLAQAIAELRHTSAHLDAVRHTLADSAHDLSASLDRLDAQREFFRRRAEIGREIERAADRLSAVIESGDLAAAERLVPEFEAIARVAAADGPATAG